MIVVSGSDYNISSNRSNTKKSDIINVVKVLAGNLF
jgi:hypothetical protein